MSYTRFFAMIVTSTVVMFGLMYLNTYLITHVFFSETRAYMAVLMGAVMAIIMLAFMLGMYTNKNLNIAIFAGSIIVFGAMFWLVRSQTTIGDVSYMRAMIPHHSIAIMTSSRANIEDERTRKLADEIIYAQDKEIAEMRYMIAQIETDGLKSASTGGEQAAQVVSVEQALSEPKIAVMDAEFISIDDINEVFPDGPDCTFNFTTESPASLALGDAEGTQTALLKINGNLVQLEATGTDGSFSSDGLSATLTSLGDDRMRANSRLVIQVNDELTAGYDGFSNCAN